MSNICPECKYAFMHRIPKKKIEITKIEGKEESFVQKITHTKAQYYVCNECGYDSRYVEEKKGFIKRWFG